MKTIYFIDGQGKRVSVEVSDEVATEYHKSRQEQWRGDAYEHYHTILLDRITEMGHEFADESSNVEQQYIEKLDEARRQKLLRKLRKVLPQLTEIQRTTIHKLFVLNKTQADIAREEKISEQAVSDRISHLYARIKKLIKKS